MRAMQQHAPKFSQFVNAQPHGLAAGFALIVAWLMTGEAAADNWLYVSLKAEFGNCFINPKATTSDGAFIDDTVTRALPAAQVPSVAADERHFWFGTTNGLLRITDHPQLTTTGNQ